MLERYKTLYCVAVMAAGVILAARAGFIGWLAAVLILAFALPAWRAVTRSAASQALLNTFILLEDDLRNPKDDQASGDRKADHRSA